jgi:hypothetical protein
MLTENPSAAADKFERAHDLALKLGQAENAASLSTLIARSWHLRNSLVRCIRFSRRAVREAPNYSGSQYTLGHFCEKAAYRAVRSRKPRRAILFFFAARNAFATAAHLTDEAMRRASLEGAAEDCEREVQRLLTDLS